MRKVSTFVQRKTEIGAEPELPRVEYEDIIADYGRLNKDISKKESRKFGLNFSAGDILFGKLRPYLKNWLLPDFSGLAVGDFWVLTPILTSSKFLYYLIQTPEFFMISNQSAGSKMPRSDWEVVSKHEFYLPHKLKEQVKIGAFFRALDDLITLHQRKYDKLVKVKKSMLEKLFPKNGSNVPEIRFSDFTGPWELRKANDLFIATADKNHPELPVLAATQEFGMVKREEKGMNIYHDKKNEMTYKRVLPGQFVIHLRSFQGGFAHSSIEGITSPAYTVFGFNKPKKHCDCFWKHIFQSDKFIKRLETVTYGIRDGRSISYEEFLSMSFLVPSCAEQKQIAYYLGILDNLISLHHQELEKLQRVKKSFLEKMFV